MNKQTEDTLSKRKTLEWIDANWEMERTAGTADSSVRAEMWHEFYDKINDGSFAPDPISPTIKPGDNAYHKKYKAKCEVKELYNNSKKAVVYWLEDAPTYYVNLVNVEDLEVSNG